MRNMIWNWTRAKVPEGTILPWWALTVRAVLYPLEFLFWRMSQTRGYQGQNDTWLIDGVTYSGEALRQLAKAHGETYRVTRTGKTVTLERVHNEKLRGCPIEKKKDNREMKPDRAEGQSLLNDGFDTVHEALKNMLPQERIAFVEELMSPYCRYCGWKDPGHSCQCWKDKLGHNV